MCASRAAGVAQARQTLCVWATGAAHASLKPLMWAAGAIIITIVSCVLQCCSQVHKDLKRIKLHKKLQSKLFADLQNKIKTNSYKNKKYRCTSKIQKQKQNTKLEVIKTIKTQKSSYSLNFLSYMRSYNPRKHAVTTRNGTQLKAKKNNKLQKRKTFWKHKTSIHRKWMSYSQTRTELNMGDTTIYIEKIQRSQKHVSIFRSTHIYSTHTYTITTKQKKQLHN